MGSAGYTLEQLPRKTKQNRKGSIYLNGCKHVQTKYLNQQMQLNGDTELWAGERAQAVPYTELRNVSCLTCFIMGVSVCVRARVEG